MTEENFQKRLGRIMTFLGWIVLLGLLTILFSKYLDRQNNPNQNLALKTLKSQTGINQEVQLQRNRYGHYVANGMINNHPVVFILDTGATEISIPEKVAQRLKLKAGMKIPVNTANGEIDVFATRLERVGLGAIELHDIRANINPFIQGEEILLGMSFLKHLHFSQEGDKLLIRQY
jgi:aspartyl protease family protein